MRAAEVEEPVEGKVEARHVAVLAGGGDGLEHGVDGVGVAAEVGLQDGEVHEGVLIEEAVAGLHRVVEVAVEVVEGVGVVAGTPAVEEAGGASVRMRPGEGIVVRGRLTLRSGIRWGSCGCCLRGPAASAGRQGEPGSRILEVLAEDCAIKAGKHTLHLLDLEL